VQALGAVLKSDNPDRWDVSAVHGVVISVVDTDPRVRIAAVQALDGATQHSAVNALASALGDPEAEIRCSAASGLRRADTGPVTERLLTASGDDLPQVRAAALTGLAASRGRQAVQARGREALADADSTVRIAAVRLLRTDDPTNISTLLGLLEHDHGAEVRREVLSALRTTADPRAPAALTAALRDSEPIVAGAAADALSGVAAARVNQRSHRRYER